MLRTKVSHFKPDPRNHFIVQPAPKWVLSRTFGMQLDLSQAPHTDLLVLNAGLEQQQGAIRSACKWICIVRELLRRDPLSW